MARHIGYVVPGLFAAGLLTTAMSPKLSAQHSDIGVYQEVVVNDGVSDRRIVTLDDSNVKAKVFLRSFDFFGHPFGNQALPRVYAGDDPGFVANNPPNGYLDLPARENLRIHFLPFDVGSGVSNLFYWNGEGNVAFDAVPQDHKIYVTDILNSESVLDGSIHPVDGGLAAVTDAGGGIHQHVQFRLDDNDSNDATEPDRGIYVFGAQLRMNGVSNSEPFAMGLSSPDVTLGTRVEAVEWLATNFDDFLFGPVGDFDQNGLLEVDDIDLLVETIAAEAYEAAFDLNEDGSVTITDLDQWRSLAGEALLVTGQPIEYGDANLDGIVDEADLEVWFANRFTVTAAWSAGDFTADGFVDGSDFNLWIGNRSPAAGAVPEPNGFVLAFLTFSLFLSIQRKEQAS